MLSLKQIEPYKQYLHTVQAYLDKYFDNQKEYLSCQKGCAYCCKKGTYPLSQIEFEYLLIGFFKLNFKEQQDVIKKIQNLKQEYNSSDNKEKFMYQCPFLSDDNFCMVYDYRSLICRTFGLLKFDKDEKIIIPFCRTLGLNYSKVYNQEKNMLDDELIKKYGYKNSPKAYDLSFKTLMNNELFKDLNIDFGEIKSLVEWL